VTVALRCDGPERGAATIVLAHGAGAPMDDAFLETIARGLAARDFRVVRFEFPYMAQRRETGARKGPDRAPVLLDTWRGVVTQLGGGAGLVIGGKSMGAASRAWSPTRSARAASSVSATRSIRRRSPSSSAPRTSRRCARPP